MGAPEPKRSVDKAALGASLPGATAHAISRLLFRWLLLPTAIVLPVGGAAALAWQFIRLRPSAEDVAATQAAVAKLTDEAEGAVDEELRSDTDPDIQAADVARGRRRGGLTREQLEAIATTMASVKYPPTGEELLVDADEARRQGQWEEAARRYKLVVRAQRSSQRTMVTATLAQAQILLDHLGDARGALSAYTFIRDIAWHISPELGAQADRGLERARLQVQ